MIWRAASLVLAVTLSLPGQLAAHEFWIDPHVYEVAPDTAVLADLRVGQEFQGAAFSFIPTNFRRFDLVMNGATKPVEGRAGDRPALNVTPAEEGLMVVAHETRDMSLTYKEWPKFEKFARHKDFTWALEAHLDRALPQEGFKEQYSRYAKSLIAVGAGAGADAPVGLETEIVALANPYVDDVSGGMPVQVLYQGDVRADVQVELFDRDPSGAVTITLHRTNAEGISILPVTPGHAYLVDAVVIRPMEPENERGPVWETLWASLTFGVPD